MPNLPTRLKGVRILLTPSTVDTNEPQGMWQTGAPQDLTMEAIVGERGLTASPSYSLDKGLRRYVRCACGSAFVVAVDVRIHSPTFGQWQAFYLQDSDHRCLKIPAGVAVGWQLLEDTEIEIGTSDTVTAELTQTLPWDDPRLRIAWPRVPSELDDQDGLVRCLDETPPEELPGQRLYRSPSSRNRSAATSSPAKLAEHAPPSPVASKANSQLRSQLHQRDATQEESLRAASPWAANRMPEERPILVIGSNGKLGRELARELRSLGTVVEACRETEAGTLWPRQLRVDVSRPASLRALVREVQPSLIVNATALTDVEQAEQRPRLAQLVNANAPMLLAEEAQRSGAGIVHFCSDMVFDGRGTNAYRESDTPQPLNHYARTKLLGTQAVQTSGASHLVIRCGWLYASCGENFVRSMPDLMTYRQTVTFQADYCGTPTAAEWVARSVTKVLQRGEGQFARWLEEHGGLYHLSPRGYASRAEVANEVWRLCKSLALPVQLRRIESLPVSELPSLAAIPANCRLNAGRFQRKFGVELPSWQEQLREQLTLMVGHQRSAMASA